MCVAAVCRAQEEGQVVDAAVAFVNDRAITLSEVMGNAYFLLRDPRWVGERSREEAQRDALEVSREQLIEQRLILQEYEAGKARLPDWVVDKRIAETIDTEHGGDQTQLLRRLAEQRMAFEAWREMIRQQIVVSFMRQVKIDGQVHVSPADIVSYYRAHLSDFTVEAATEVSLFHVPPRDDIDEAIAEAAMRLAQNRARFADVAAEFDPALRNRGYRGWIDPEESLRDDLAEALGEMAVGEVRAVHAGEDGAFVLYKMGQRVAGTLPFVDAQPRIEDLLFEQEARRLYAAWIASLRANAKITKREFDQP